MNGSNNKNMKIVIILMAIASVVIMGWFAFSLTKEDSAPTGTDLPINSGTSQSVSTTDTVA